MSYVGLLPGLCFTGEGGGGRRGKMSYNRGGGVSCSAQLNLGANPGRWFLSPVSRCSVVAM